MKLTEKEKYYSDLAEVYLSVYENHLAREYKIMMAKGVIVEMESDLIAFLKKGNETDKSKSQSERLKILNDAIDMFASISSANVQTKYVIKATYRENKELKEEVSNLILENEDLKNQLRIANEQLFDKD